MTDNAGDIDFAGLDGCGWSNLLERKPQFADKCDWEKLDGGDWVRLLKVRPEFADKCDWDKLIDRSFGFGGRMGLWVELLGARPEFADKCDLKMFDDSEWASLICAQPAFAEQCDISRFAGRYLRRIFTSVPQVAEKIDWRKVDWQHMDDLADGYPELRRFQMWRPDVFVGYAEEGQSIAASVSDKFYSDWFLSVSGSIEDRIDEINSCQVFVPVLTPDFDIGLLDRIRIPIVPVWPNGEQNRDSLPDGYEVTTLDMTGTDFESSVVRAGCRFPDELLDKRNSVAEHVENGDWAKLVVEFPEYLFGARRVELDADDWAHVLIQRPDLAFGCDFSDFSGDDWMLLLMSQPSFADQCDFAKLDGRTRFGDSRWKCLLRYQPQFSDRCSFENFTGNDWVELLELQPQFADKCDWSTLSGENWCSLLREHPQFADECDRDKISEAESGDVRYLLAVQPQFIDKCDLASFGGSDWRDLLQAQPELAKYCDWNKLGLSEFVDVICKCPEFASEFSWPAMPGFQWTRLLSVCPQFSDRCQWERLKGSDWRELLICRPQFSGKCDWSKLSGWDWAWLLASRPEMESHCDWSRFAGKDWVKLLTAAPSFSEHCNWSRLSDNDWRQLLEAQPQFAKYFVAHDENDDSSYYDVYVCFDPERTTAIAKRLIRALEERGFGVYANARNVVDEESEAALKVSRHFLLIRSEGIYDHLGEDGDPISKQVSAALECEKGVVFVGPSDQKWQDSRMLPPAFASLQTQQVKILDVEDLFEVKVDAIVRECLNEMPGSLNRKFDVFISYRRSTGAKFARRMQQGLKKAGCTSFLDYDSILNGKYDKVIHSAIDNSAVFLMLLTDESLNRCCTDPDDWVAAEIRAAHAKKMCVVPITPSDQSWRLPENLPDDMRWLIDVEPLVVNMKEDGFEKSISEIIEEFPSSLQEKRGYIVGVRDRDKYDDAEHGLPLELPELLEKYPDSISLFPFRNFSGAVWSQILRKVPSLSYKCDWSLLDDFQIVKVLCDQPQFADRCNWSNLSGNEIEMLLTSQPQFADKCDLEQLDSCDIASLLCVQPQLESRFNLSRIDYGGPWVMLLKAQPQFAGQCDWSLLTGEDWAELLAVRPEFAEKCDWEKVKGVGQRELCKLLSAQPGFLDKVDWRSFNGKWLARLLVFQPQLMEDCVCDRLGVQDWTTLLAFHPEFKGKCDSDQLTGQQRSWLHDVWNALESNPASRDEMLERLL